MCKACVGKLLGTIGASQIIQSPPKWIAEEVNDPADLKPNVIFCDGKIITMTGGKPDYPEAIAISRKSGRITALGTMNAVTAATPDADIVELKGRTLMPGFIDPHQHTLTGSILTSPEVFTNCGYDQCKTTDEVKTLISRKVSEAKAGDFLSFSLYDNLRQGRDFTMAELSQLAPDNPVFIYYINMHTAAGNELAFKAADINPNPAYYDTNPFPDGGHLGLSNGTGDGWGDYKQYNGMIYEEGAIMPFLGLAVENKITTETLSSAVKKWGTANVECGNTTIHEAGIIHSPISNEEELHDFLEQYAALLETIPCRTTASLMYDDIEHMELDEAQKLFSDFNSDKDDAAITKPLTLHGIKIVADGSNQALTACQTMPYLNSSDCGKMNLSSADLDEQVMYCASLQLPVLIHCNGDQALDDAISAIEGAYCQSEPRLDYGINRIEHCTITRPEQLEDISTLGIQPSFLMNHVYYYGKQYKDDLLGEERTSRMDPAQDCVGLSLPFSLHTDAPCSNIGPLQLVHVAVNRTYEESGRPGKESTSPDQSISPYEALRAVTLTAARHIGMEKYIGSLEEGKFADLVILDKNPVEVPSEDIFDINVCETWVGGRQVYTAKEDKVCLIPSWEDSINPPSNGLGIHSVYASTNQNIRPNVITFKLPPEGTTRFVHATGVTIDAYTATMPFGVGGTTGYVHFVNGSGTPQTVTLTAFANGAIPGSRDFGFGLPNIILRCDDNSPIWPIMDTHWASASLPPEAAGQTVTFTLPTDTSAKFTSSTGVNIVDQHLATAVVGKDGNTPNVNFNDTVCETVKLTASAPGYAPAALLFEFW